MRLTGKASILTVDDEPELLELLSDTLEGDGYRVVQSRDGAEALAKAANEEFSAIITDIRMPRIDGLTFIDKMNKNNAGKKSIPIIAISGDMDDFEPKLALINNVSMLEKPFSGDEILELLDKALNPSKHIDKEGGKSQKINLNAGELLMQEGDQGDVMYWLVDGSLEVYQRKDGQDVQLGIIHSGELVGEMSFLDQRARSASVRALKDSELLIIPNGKFAKVIEAQPGWFKSLVRTLSGRLRDANKKITL